ncbi:MAG: ABC transporter ATP-binding protein [Alphaproteobacteria bacterium]|nr:ABC transporter ATP-binding protein [Alphaproteobacteria bacterium]
MSVFAFILKYLKKTKMMATIILVALIARSIADRGETYALAQVIGILPDYAKDHTLIKHIFFFVGLLTFFLIFESVANFLWRYYGGKFMPYFCSLVYKDIFIAVHHHSIGFFNEEMAGKIASKTKNVVSGIKEIYGEVVFGLIRPVTGIAVTLFLVFYANVQLGFIIFALSMIFMISIVLVRRRIGSFSEKRARFSAETDGVFIDTVTNSDLVKSFANYFYEKGHFYHTLRTAVRAEQKERTKDAWFDLQGKWIFYLSYLLCCISIFYYWYLGKLQLADVVMCITLMQGLMMEVNNIGFFAGEFSQAYGQVKDGLDLLFKPCLVEDAPDAYNLKLRDRTINFENIDYHYKDKSRLFNNFNLKIKSGEKVGLVGHSGSGKSTLIKLLIRYFDVDSGRITVGGEDIRKVRQESLRAQIAVIPQDTTLFNRTILENIRYGNVNASDEEVIAAAKQAYADEFIKELPNGYDSRVGERGVMLSGGERQRVAIARAILKNAPILILDEATSALDSKSEQYIQKSLKRLMKGKTVIAIAHRLSTLKEMDRLVVMDNGRIVEEGSHKDLLAKKGIYYDFYQMQSLNK